VIDDLKHVQILTKRFIAPKPALFLDRDGVVIEDRHYLSNPDDVQLCPGAVELIESCNIYNFPVVLITNQSGIARGYFDWPTVEAVHERMRKLLGQNALFSAIYANGYGPGPNLNSWRKPSPQMLFKAAQDLNLDLENSILVGDRLSDIQAGVAANVSTIFHVLRGHGARERESVVQWHRDFLSAKLKLSASTKKCQTLSLLDSLLQFPMHLLSKQETLLQ
jgi:D-glycero-D-manno-heptose 1,7-bisphosphate phosphatase